MRTLITLAITFGLCATAFAGKIKPRDTEVFEIDIPTQRLEKALQSLADQTGVVIAYSRTELGLTRSNSVAGEMSYDSALSKMLTGTGFQFSDNGDGEVTIRPRTANTGRF